MPKRHIEQPLRAEVDPPKPFTGHAQIVDYFRRLGRENLAHAYLFYGPRGVGKKTFANALAWTLHCERPSSFPTGYCGNCSRCRRAIAGASGDIIVVNEDFHRAADERAGKAQRTTSAMGVESSRYAIQLMQHRSYEGGRLVCIVPEFDDVTGDAAYNALLKELEEPDSGKLFLLVAEQVDRVLPTVRSRAVEIRFGPLTAAEIAEQLVRHYGVKRDKAAILARRAQGSLGEALEELTEDAAPLRGAARKWLLACLTAPNRLPPMPALSGENREDARGALAEVLRRARIAARDLMAYALAGEKNILDLESKNEYEKARRALGDAAVRRSAAALAAIDEATRMSTTYIPPATIFGWLQVRLRST